jgi:hypothetical protein
LISYGLGWQRYDHAVFVPSQFSPNSEIAVNNDSDGSAYMSPNELLALMQQNPIYQLETSQID